MQIIKIIIKDLKLLLEKKNLILNELKMNNKQMSSNYLLGNLWNIIFLFLELFIYYFLLVIIFKKSLFGETATFIGVLVGIIHFRLINNIIVNSARSILKNSNVLLQFKINPLIFFSVEFLHSLKQSFLFFFIGLFLCLIEGLNINFNIIFYPVVFFFLILFCWGLSLIMTVILTKFKDMDKIMSFFFRILFYLSPVIYPHTLVPEKINFIYFLNPFAIFLSLVQSCFFNFSFISSLSIIYCLILTVSVFLFSHLIFQKNKNKFFKLF